MLSRALGRRSARLRRWVTVVAFGLVASLLAFVPSVAPADAAAVPTDEIAITPTGFEPASAVVEPGTTVLWRNDTVAPNTVTSADGLVDSGPIPPGGGFTATLPGQGWIDLVDAYGNPGVVTLGSMTLGGPGDALAVSVIPDTSFPPFAEEELGSHPDTTVVLSRRRLVVGVALDATVAEVNVALGAAGTPIVGGIADDGLLLVATPAGGNFAATEAAATVLEDSPAIEFAVLDGPVGIDALPADPEPAFDADLPVGPDGWTWNEATISPGTEYTGRGANWSLENVRAPQVWNLREAIEDWGGAVVGALVDSEVQESHPALPHLEQVDYCTGGEPQRCAVDSKQTTHGTHVAGIVSGSWEPSPDFAYDGRVSLDNGTRLLGLPWGATNGAGTLSSFSLIALHSELVSRAEAGEPIRVINQSAGTPVKPQAWADSRRIKRCHPGRADDGLAGGGACLPSNDDVYLRQMEERALPLRRVLKRGAQEGILFVNSAGNKGQYWCSNNLILYNALSPQSPLPSPCIPEIPTAMGNSTLSTLGLDWTGSQWADPAPGPNPVLVVEALGARLGAADFAGTYESFTRAPFSQVGGHVSAPGTAIYSTCRSNDTQQDTSGSNVWNNTDPFHCRLRGTSMAAPLVASLALVLSRHSSAPAMRDVRKAILAWASPNTSGGASPHIDAFASLMSLDGAARELVDVNDHSLDGNRRVFRDGSGDEIFDPFDDGAHTDRDGEIDLRDFRRFRDAWLQLCGTAAADPTCPATVLLDGAADHVKRDLNLDGCVVGGAATCRQDESVYPRFDFNGDGRLTRYDLMPMPFDEDGSLLGARPAVLEDQPWLSDLEVLRSQFDPIESGDWTRDDLDALMISGDLHINAQSLFDFGATSVGITASHPQTVDPGTGAPRGLTYTLTPDPLDPDEGRKVVTVLADQPAELVITATFPAPTGEVVVVDQTLTLSSGEDHFVNACGIDVEVAPPVVAPDSLADLTATISGCGPDAAVEGLAVDLSLSPLVVDGAVLASSAPPTDATGMAATTIETGTILQGYTVTASATLIDSQGAPVTITGEATFRVDAAYEMEIIDFTRATGPESLGHGPGIASDGTVGYKMVDSAGEEIWYDEGLGRFPVPSTRINTDPDPAVVLGWYGKVSVTDDGAVWALNERVEPADVGIGGFQRRREIIRQPLPSGTQDLTTISHLNLLGVIDADADYEVIALPSPNDSGGVVYPVRPFGDPGPLYRLATPVDPDDFVGPAIATVPLDANFAFQPVHADNGATAVNALLSAGDPIAAANAIVVGPDVLGIDDTFDGFLLAYDPINNAAVTDPTAPAYFSDEDRRFVALGDQVAMSQDGRVIAFLGDKGGGWGLYLYFRPDPTSAAFEGPLLVMGENDVNPTPDLGVDAQGDPIIFATWETDTRIGIELNEAGPAGLDGDHVILSYIATPTAEGDGFTNWTGLFTSDVELESTAGGTVLHNRLPVAAIQINDRIDATTRVADIGIWDPIDEGPSSDAGDHRLVWWQALDDGGEQIIRATRITGGAEAAAQLQMASGVFRLASSPQVAQNVSASPAALTDARTPMATVVVAMVIEDLTPVAGEAVQITNRSRDSLGTTLGAALTTSDGGSPVNLLPDRGRDIVPAAEGPWTVTLTVDDGTTTRTASVDLAVAVAPNNPPVAVTDGPWIVPDGGRVVLDASASTDPDAGDAIVAFDWDFDGNFDFGESSGSIVDLSIAEFEALACVTSCERNVPLTIRVRVTDTGGLFEFGGDFLTLSSDTADFTLRIDPASQFMNPGVRTDLLVKVNGLGGYDDPVDLTVEALPAGWSASINPLTVTPSGTALLSVFPDEAAPEGEVPIQVTGTSGEVIRTTGSTASVTFALIPVCTATVTGRVTDIDTGLPLTEADRVVVIADDDRSFWAASAISDADGRYTITEVPVTTRLLLRAGAFSDGDYWGTTNVLRQTVCDATVEVDFELEQREFGTVIGRIVEAVADPTDPTAGRDLYPSDIPVEGIRARTAGIYEDISAVDGTFRIENIPLNSQNAPRNISVFGGENDYWGTSVSTTIREGAVIDVGDLPILERCSSTVSATGRVFDTDGSPVQTWVRLGYNTNVQTAVDGTFSIGPIEQPLGTNNSAVDVTLLASPLFFGGFGDSVRIPVPNCDLDISEYHELVVEAEPPPPPPDNLAVLEGRVVDERTGLGVGGAQVYLFRFGGFQDSDRADADGNYLFDDVFVGVGDDTTNDSYSVRAVARNRYWDTELSPEFALDSTTPTVRDIEMEPIDKATVTGVVVDSATQQPIEWAVARVGTIGDATGPDGRFEITGLIPGEGNVPIVASGFANKSSENIGTPGRWYTSYFDVVLEPGGTTEVRLELLQLCTDVSIHGLVINAETLLPEPDVRVLAPGASDYTGPDGTFLLEEVTLNVNNEPATVTVSASKSGFLTLRRSVTVFCGANVRIDFGAPNLGTGTVTGVVTDAATGDPIEGAFIGSEFGGRDTTDAAGSYLLTGVPVAFDGSPRDWEIDVVGPRGATAEAIVTVAVDAETVQDFQLSIPANQAPTALAQSVDTDPDTAVGITLSGTDPDGDPLTFSLLDQPTAGSLIGTGSARVYTPDPGTTSDSFTFTVFDGELTSEPATVDVTVVVPNQAPTADAQSVTVAEDDSVVITLTGGDPDGDPFDFELLSLPGDGSLSGGVPVVVYEPDPDYNGPDEFTFAVYDWLDSSPPAAITITVTPVPDPPVAVADSDATAEGVAVTTDVASNDSDVDGDLDPTTVRIVTPPTGGTAEAEGDGTVTFTPAPGASGADEYVYEICDATGLCDTALVSITVQDVVIPPPDLVVDVIDSLDPVVPGGAVTYMIDYRNDGGDASGVTVTATVPAHSTFDMAASTLGWVCAPDDRDGAVCSIDIGLVGGGASGSVTFASVLDATVGAGFSEATTIVEIGDDGTHGPDVNPADNMAQETTTVEAAPDLVLTKSDDGDSQPGGTITYTLAYGNVGDQDATGVVIEERVPGHTSFDSASNTAGWLCEPGGAAGSLCRFEVGSLSGGGGSGEVRFFVTVADPLTAGVSEVMNRAEVVDDATNGVDPNILDNVAEIATSVNRPPVADAGGPYTGPEGGVVELDAGGSLDPEGGALSLEWDLDGDGEFDDATGATVQYPAADGPASVTVAVRATDLAGLSDTATASVDVVNVDPEVDATLVALEVQYSDAIASVTVTATDVAADTPDNITVTHAYDGGAFVAGLPGGLVLAFEGCLVAAGSSCGWTLTGAADTRPGVYAVHFEVADEDGGIGTVDVVLTVLTEDAVIGFDGANPFTVGVTTPGGDSDPFTLTVGVSEVDVPGDVIGDTNLAGDIRTASVDVSLVPVGPGSTVAPTAACSVATTAGLVDPESAYDYDLLTVSCGFHAVPVNTYVVMVDVGGHYAAFRESVVTVSDPSLGFITGGGRFLWPGTDDVTNFGFTVRHNRKGTNIRGNLLLIRHLADGTRYRIKSNSLGSLALGELDDGGWAVFTGKSTYLEPGWLEPEGNHSFVVYVEDHGEPGTGGDRIWLQVRDKDGELTSLALSSPSTVHAEVIDGGNIVVPHLNNAHTSPR